MKPLFSVFVHFQLGHFKLVTVSSSSPFHALVPSSFVVDGDAQFPLRFFRRHQVSAIVFEHLCCLVRHDFVFQNFSND